MSERSSRAVMWAFMAGGLAVFGLMVCVGIALRAEQATWITYDAGTFYSLMTLHGAGMIVAMALCGMGGLWYIMDREHPMDRGVAWSAFAAIVLGVVCVILSIYPGHFGAGWTFLFPLPF